MSWRWPALGLLALFGLSLLWMAGFAAFDRDARRPGPPPPHSDGIVALTGGADRIETALQLLSADRAPILLVSGVGRGTDLVEVIHRVPVEPTALAERVTLGRMATTTVGNAAETAAWARQHKLRTLIVVTAGYHMARALLEIGRELPDVELYPVAVQPPALRGQTGLTTLRLLAVEYDKFLAVRLGLHGFLKGVRL